MTHADFLREFVQTAPFRLRPDSQGLPQLHHASLDSRTGYQVGLVGPNLAILNEADFRNTEDVGRALGPVNLVIPDARTLLAGGGWTSRKLRLIERWSYWHRVAALARRVVLRQSRVRVQQYVKAEYEQIGSQRTPEWNALQRATTRLSDRGPQWITEAQFRAAWLEVLTKIATETSAQVVLEAGVGEGKNFGLLALLNPGFFGDRRWLGFDYSIARVDRARQLIVERLKAENAYVWNGDLKQTYLRSQSVDLAFTFHVLEQLPYDWQAALRELARVARFVLLAEPFYAHKRIAGRLHSRANDYIRASIEDVCGLGFRLVSTHSIAYQDPFNETTIVLLQPTGA